MFARLHHAYPDLHMTVEDMIEEGDKVVSRNTVTGTHQSEYIGGLQPSGRSVTYTEIFILRFSGGRIVESSGVVDVLTQMQQLGVIPPLDQLIARAATPDPPHVEAARERA